MNKNKPPKSPATKSLVKTVTAALRCNIKHCERFQAKIQGRSQVPDSHMDLSNSAVVTDIGHADGFKNTVKMKIIL